MTINFKQPKYILPLIALPFLCLFFYVYSSGVSPKKKETQRVAGINVSVGDVSPDIKKRKLEDKLDAYRNTYKESDGKTAVIPIPTEATANPALGNSGLSGQEKMLDSINQLMKMKYGASPGRGTGSAYRRPGLSEQDKELAAALNNLSNRQKDKAADQSSTVQQKAKDPMEVFRQQIAYMDSIRKAGDPAYLAEKQKQQAKIKADAEELKSKEKLLEVVKADDTLFDFNTVMPKKNGAFIMAVIDENVTGYAGSRIRLRLLEDIKAGNTLVQKGTYLYALINGFSGQRVTLSVKSILYNNKLLPVKLDVYDQDGLQGLYVPESQFRDFTKDLGSSSIQGVSIEDNGTGSVASQMLMSTAGKMFESTSSAIAGAIRKDKAKIKYNSYIYLIDSHAQENAHNNN